MKESNIVPAMQDVFVTFEAIDKMEEKRKGFEAEADVIRQNTIEAWNMLFDAIIKACSKHQDSNCLFNSKMGDLLSAHKRFMTDKLDQPQADEQKAGAQ